MIKFVIYLLESSVLLAIFYLLYIVVMRKETFFDLNRFFLIGIVVLSLIFPLVSFDFSQGEIIVLDSPIEEFNRFRMSYYEPMIAWENEVYRDPIALNESSAIIESSIVNVDWTAILMKFLIGIYTIGTIVCLSKMFWAIRRIRKMIKIYPQKQIDGVTVVKVPNPIAPFSFLKYAFVYEGIIDTLELDQIIAHEKTHIEQKHSVDLIFVQFLAAFLWFNPLIWKLIKSLKTTHEYIADEKIIKAGYSLVEYQTLLLRQLVSNNSYGLVHNFNLSFIKKRITMMKNNKSGFKGKVKVALTIICAVLFSLVIVQCNSKIEEKLPVDVELESLLAEYKAQVKSGKTSSNYKNLPTFSILDNKLFIDGKPCEISEVESILEKAAIDIYDYLQLKRAQKMKEDGKPYEISEVKSAREKASTGRHFSVRLEIDGNQEMKKVREFQTELRRLDRRKVVYYGETASGKQMIQPFLVPPFHWANPSRDDSLYPKFDLTNATIEGNVATLNGIEYLKLNLSSTRVNYKEEVYKFVKKHVDKKSIAYLVSIEYEDGDVFENYLTNLAEVFQGFEKVFNVRSQEMFGKDRDDLSTSEYLEMRKGIAKAVFIAEK